MKRYSDFSDEISSSEIYEGLLGHGLFSDKLPPVFTSEDFLNYCLTNTPNFPDKWCPHVSYESMRNTNVPRVMGIPNPMAYQQLCKCISDHWMLIQTFIRQQTQKQNHIVSRIHIRKMAKTRSLFKMNYDNWRTDGTPEPDLQIGSKYIVHADISTFFPSIYTHSIPWALVGKDFAKQHVGNRWANEWYNQIDHYTQNCKNGETHGVLIGPHASNLIGEIILSCVDSKLVDRWHYIRNIDDYTCFVETYEEAQLFLLTLSAELREFDLTLNHKKTKISMLPMAMTKQWVRQVCNIAPYVQDGIMDYISTRSYLDSAVEIMQNNAENSAILNYAIKVLPTDKMSQNAIDYCVKTVIHLCLLYPYLIQILDESFWGRFHVPNGQIKSFAERIYNQEVAKKNYDAVCHALFFALKYGFTIDTIKPQDAIDSNSCLFRLLAFLYFKKNALKKELIPLRALAHKLKSNVTDFGQNWLFVYEVLPQSNLPGDWKQLKANDVSFLRKEYRF